MLIGTSGQAGHFTDEIILEMKNNSLHPIIFPLSNPNTNSESKPEKIYKLTNGKAIVATGSPFPSFNFKGEKITIGQGNNLFIFPGVGLGAIISKGDYISDSVFTEVAYCLSELTPNKLIEKGTIYPNIKNIRNISANIAYVTTQQISIEQSTEQFSLEKIKKYIWKPHYHPLIKIP